MKINIFKSLVAAVAVTFGAAGVTGCQDHFDDWDLSAPVADIEANTTILDFKKEFWNENSTNYCVEIPAREDGSHYIVKGRVISSDRESNVFKCLYIQDETAALPISINQYSLYVNNRPGQELVIDLTGLYCGRYAGMFQIGAIDYDEKTGDTQTTFLDPEIFMLHRQLNGIPDPAKIDTFTIEDLSVMTNDPLKWQGQLVQFNNVTFTNGNNPDNNQLCNKYQSSGYNQEITGTFGSLNIRTSGYSTFWNEKIPAEACDVAGIAGYYSGSSPWQLILNDLQGIMNIGNPTAEGSQNQPYTVERAIELSAADNTTGWVKGYIVGTIQPEITTISSSADIQWIGTEPFIVDNYVVIAPSPETRDYKKCMLVPLAAGSALYTYGNLVDHPELAGRTLNIRGRFSSTMGMASVAGNDGSAPTFRIQGVDVPGSDEPEPEPDGDGSEDKPYSVTQVLKLNNPGTLSWMEGYIVGSSVGVSGAFEPVNLKADGNSPSNILVAATPTETDINKMVVVQLVYDTDARKSLNLVDNPGVYGKKVALQGKLEKYFNRVGMKETGAFKLDGQSGTDPTPPSGLEGDGTEEKPYTASDVITLNNPGTDSWVVGYIVGTADGVSGAFEPVNFTANGSNSKTNLLIAATPDERDLTKIVPVQLPTTDDIRANLNLADNPGNLGKKIKLKGKLEKYFNRPGVRSITTYEL